MTQKDYKIIAAAFREYTANAVFPGEVTSATEGEFVFGAVDLQRIADTVANCMVRDNPKFDKAKFMAACGF